MWRWTLSWSECAVREARITAGSTCGRSCRLDQRRLGCEFVGWWRSRFRGCQSGGTSNRVSSRCARSPPASTKPSRCKRRCTRSARLSPPPVSVPAKAARGGTNRCKDPASATHQDFTGRSRKRWTAWSARSIVPHDAREKARAHEAPASVLRVRKFPLGGIRRRVVRRAPAGRRALSPCPALSNTRA